MTIKSVDWKSRRFSRFVIFRHKLQTVDVRIEMLVKTYTCCISPLLIQNAPHVVLLLSDFENELGKSFRASHDYVAVTFDRILLFYIGTHINKENPRIASRD